jgi:hypothetical protein
VALIGFQAALFFAPKPSSQELLEALRANCNDFAAAVGFDVRPLSPASEAALAGDDRAYQEIGRQIIVVCSIEDAESTVLIAPLDAYSQSNALMLSPSIAEADRDLTNLTWTHTVHGTKVLIERLRPTVAQINGLDEEVGGQVVSPKTIAPATVPTFVTPFTYVEEPGGTRLARAASAAGVHRVQRLAAGWAIQFVPDFYAAPPAELTHELEREFGDAAPEYRQTDV